MQVQGETLTAKARVSICGEPCVVAYSRIYNLLLHFTIVECLQVRRAVFSCAFQVIVCICICAN